MSSHKCVRCLAGKKPDSWTWYAFLPQPGEETGSQYWVLCEPCEIELLKKAWKLENRDCADDNPAKGGSVYVYIKSESQLWTVGFYKPDGKWESESDHTTPKEAADRVISLNGGVTSDQIHKIQQDAYQAGFTAGQGLKG